MVSNWWRRFPRNKFSENVPSLNGFICLFKLDSVCFEFASWKSFRNRPVLTDFTGQIIQLGTFQSRSNDSMKIKLSIVTALLNLNSHRNDVNTTDVWQKKYDVEMRSVWLKLSEWKWKRKHQNVCQCVRDWIEKWVFFHKRGGSIAFQPILHSLPKKQLSLNTIVCVWAAYSIHTCALRFMLQYRLLSCQTSVRCFCVWVWVCVIYWWDAKKRLFFPAPLSHMDCA